MKRIIAIPNSPTAIPKQFNEIFDSSMYPKKIVSKFVKRASPDNV
jgi:hypothetical protein